MDRVRIDILGQLQASGPDGPIALGGRKQRLLLADLVLNIGSSLSTDRLIDDLWGEDPPPTAAGTLQAYVSRLRSRLGRDVIARNAVGYSLVAGRVSIDALEFDGLVTSADELRSEEPASAAVGYRAALDLWRGEMLGELGSEPFARADVVRREEIRASVAERLFDIELERGGTAELVAEIRAAIDRHPLREAFWRQLMVSLYRGGRQAEALRAFQEIRERLGSELGIGPSAQLVELEERILLQDPLLRRAHERSALRPRSNHPTNLPVETRPFIGRDDEIGAVSAALASSSVVTITGAGGIGKTRLALTAGLEELARSPGGVWMADLALEHAPGRVAAPLLAALGLEWRDEPLDISRIATRVGSDRAIVVLDNCEHLLDAASALAETLARTGGIRVLATSRVPLGLSDEYVVALRSLDVPQATDSFDDFREREAVLLFETMGEANHPGFRVTPANQPAITRVLEVVDGVPLAIELSAALLPLWTVGQLADQINEKLFGSLVAPVDADPRRASMRSVIELSYDLLEPAERTLFDRLSVFRGPFHVDHAIEASSGAGIEAGDLPEDLEGLARSSLLQPVPERGPGWYRFLEVMREYGAERLEARGETMRWRTGHAKAMLTTATAAHSRFHAVDQIVAFDEIRGIAAQLQAALEHSAAIGDSATGVALVRALWRWWFLDGEFDAGIGWIDRFGDDSVESRGALMLLLSERNGPARGDARTDRDRVMDLSSRIEATITTEAEALGLLAAGDALTGLGAFTEAERFLTPARVWFGQTRTAWAEGLALLRLAMVEGLGNGDVDAADALLARAFRLIEASEDIQLITYTHLVRSDRERLRGNYLSALEHATAARSGYAGLGLRLFEYEARLFQALSLIELGRHDDAETVIDELHAETRLRNLVRWDWIADGLRGALLVHRGRYDEALPILTATAEVGAGLDDHSLGVSLNQLVMAQLGAGDIAGAAASADRTLEVWRRVDYPWNQTVALIVGAEVALATGNPDVAAARLSTAEQLCRRLRHVAGMARVLAVRAEHARRTGEAEETIRRLATASSLRDEVGVSADAWVGARNRSLLRWASRAVGGGSVERLWAEGEKRADSWLREFADAPAVQSTS